MDTKENVVENLEDNIVVKLISSRDICTRILRKQLDNFTKEQLLELVHNSYNRAIEIVHSEVYYTLAESFVPDESGKGGK